MKYGLIGEKLSHSFSPQIHAMLGNNDYETLEIPRDKLDEYMIKRDFCGINVTIPYKQAVMKHCDHIAPAAKKIGSVNTIINRNGILYGYNTDYDGFLHMTGGTDFAGAKVLILGSGGTSLTARAVAADAKSKSIITISRGTKSEDNFDIDVYENIKSYYDSDIIINTTPVGMFPNCDSAPINLAEFHGVKAVFDVIYNPIRTALLQQAKALKIPYSGGIPMLVAQAVFAHQLFFGTKIDMTEVAKIADKLNKMMQNIVLIGMPGCGKTTVGKLLSELANLDFIDTDALVVKNGCMEISTLLTLHGEPYFRQLESEVIESLRDRKKAVIATGGGSILVNKNRAALSYNSIIVWLDRDVKVLDKTMRPLSNRAGGLEKLYRERAPIYENFADITINCNKPVGEIVKEIIGCLEK